MFDFASRAEKMQQICFLWLDKIDFRKKQQRIGKKEGGGGIKSKLMIKPDCIVRTEWKAKGEKLLSKICKQIEKDVRAHTHVLRLRSVCNCIDNRLIYMVKLEGSACRNRNLPQCLTSFSRFGIPPSYCSTLSLLSSSLIIHCSVSSVYLTFLKETRVFSLVFFVCVSFSLYIYIFSDSFLITHCSHGKYLILKRK